VSTSATHCRAIRNTSTRTKHLVLSRNQLQYALSAQHSNHQLSAPQSHVLQWPTNQTTGGCTSLSNAHRLPAGHCSYGGSQDSNLCPSDNVSNVKMKYGMALRWYDTDRGKIEVLGRGGGLSQFHYVIHKSDTHTHCSGIEPGSP